MSISTARRALYRRLPALSDSLLRRKIRGHSIRVAAGTPYRSQYGQDRVIDEVVFDGKRDGFFVDIGAHDGVDLSNTWFLEKERGWQGVCVEPQPEIFERLKQNRSCELHACCVSDKNGEVRFRQVLGADMLSGVEDLMDDRHRERIQTEDGSEGSRIITVQSKTFDDILKDRTQIDFLSIDTEGAELAILKTIDFKRYRIGCVCLENNFQSTDCYRLLRTNGFHLLLVSGDEIYVNEALLPAFPPFGQLRAQLTKPSALQGG